MCWAHGDVTMAGCHFPPTSVSTIILAPTEPVAPDGTNAGSAVPEVVPLPVTGSRPPLPSLSSGGGGRTTAAFLSWRTALKAESRSQEVSEGCFGPVLSLLPGALRGAGTGGYGRPRSRAVRLEEPIRTGDHPRQARGDVGSPYVRKPDGRGRSPPRSMSPCRCPISRERTTFWERRSWAVAAP